MREVSSESGPPEFGRETLPSFDRGNDLRLRRPSFGQLTGLPPIPGLELGAFYGLTLPKYNEFMDVAGDRTNEKFDLVPRMSYSVSGAFAREVFGVPWLNRLDWSWTDEVPHQQGTLKYFREQGFDIEPLVTQPPTGILNARSAWTFGNGLVVGLFGRNLIDERTFRPTALGGGPDFVNKIISNAGRELGVDLTYRF